MFLVDHRKLEAGDIILTGGKSMVGALVKVITFSRFSHAMIWVDSTLIHSDSGGYTQKTLKECFFKAGRKLKCLG